MNFYQTSPQALEQFFPQDEEGYALTSFGFYFSFRFPDGYRLELRRRCAEICADYWRLCGRHLVWMVTPKTCLWQRIPEGYAMQQWLQGFPDQDWVWSMIFHSGRIPSEAAEYQITGLGKSTQTFSYSRLTLILPATWFAQNPGQHPIELFLRWSAILQARDGSAGLGLIPPEDTPKWHRTSKLAAAFRQQFPGAELVDNPENVFWGLPSANWLTMIGSECIEKLGGVAGIKTRLANEALGGE
uniref:type VI immunity family protein n=1 Tax=Candidatus Thiosymbion oneisti TaxID=589554 RepID=UPI00114CBE35